MSSLSSLLAAMAALSLGAHAADARPPEKDQDVAFKGKQAGRFLSLRAIMNEVVPQYPQPEYKYLGAQLFASSGIYRLTFMKGGRVVRVEADASTGRIVGTSGI